MSEVGQASGTGQASSAGQGSGTGQASGAGRAQQASLRTALQQIYDLYRTSLLNEKYYGYKLTITNRCNTAAEIFVVVGSAASGVSGWAVWSWGYGRNLWLIIAAASTLIAALKPILQFTKQIELYGKLFGGHRANYLALQALVERIDAQRALTPAMQSVFRSIQGRYTDLARDDEPNPSRKLTARFQSEVNTRIPPERLWWGD